MSLQKLFGAFVASIAVLAAVPSEAALSVHIEIQNPGNHSVIASADADDTGHVGTASYTATGAGLGGVEVLVDSASSNAGIAPPGFPLAFLENKISATNTEMGALDVVVTIIETGFYHPTAFNGFFDLMATAQRNFAGADATVDFFFNGVQFGADDNPFAVATSTTVTGAQVAAPNVLPYSLKQIVTLHLKGGGSGNLNRSTNGDLTSRINVTATTPEPTSLALIAMGGIGLAGGAIRRRRAAKSA